MREEEEEDRNDQVVSCDSLMEETSNTKRQRLITSSSSTGTLTPLPTLPFDLLSEILCKLPVRLLVQLRCLCKSFHCLISDPKFAKKHLRMMSHHHLMLSSREFLFYNSPISSLLSSTTSSTITHTPLHYPVPRKIGGQPMTLSTCDGIFCFVNDHRSLILWNPSIRKFRLLPTPILENPQIFFFSTFSFGHDPFTDNYKIICTSSFLNQTEVRVNIMGSDYWRRIQDFPCSSPMLGPCHTSGVFVSGTVNWLTSIKEFDLYDKDSTLRAIVSLDLKNESYQNISQPEFEKGNNWNLRPGRMRDCLCIYANSGNKMFLDVWIMKEYGNKESWNKLYHVSYMVEDGFSFYRNVLYISQDDQLLMSYYYLGGGILNLVVYGSKDGTSNIREVQNIAGWTNPIVYVESLISPCS